MSADQRDEELQDSDPTDELPVLVETAVLDPGLVSDALRPGAHPLDDPTGEHTVRFAVLAAEDEHENHESRALLEQELAERARRIETLETDAGRIAAQRVERERDLEERTLALARLEQTLGERDAAIAGFEETLAERGSAVARLEQELAARAAATARLQEALGEREAALARLTESLAERDAALSQLRESLAERDATLSRLRESLAERDTANARLEESFATARAAAQASAAAHSRLAADAAGKDSRLAELELELGRERAEVQQQQAALAAQRERAAALEAELAHTRRDLAAELARPHTKAVEERMQALQEELAALGGYIANRRVRWDELEAQSAAADRRIGELERELEHRVQRQRAAEKLAHAESARAETLRRELADIGAALAARDREIAQLRDADAEPRRRIERLESELRDARAAHAQAGFDIESRPVAAVPTPGELPAITVNAVSQLETELEKTRSQVAALLTEAQTAGREAETARTALEAARTELERMRADVGKLERALIERDRSLDARNERVAGLQRDHGQQVESLSWVGVESASRDHERTALAEMTFDTPVLVCLTSDAPRYYTLTKPSITIGRGSTCDIHVLTQFVSREHARLVMDRSRVMIEDLGSTNGVFVNSVRVDRHELRHGDILTVGETQFRFLERMAH